MSASPYHDGTDLADNGSKIVFIWMLLLIESLTVDVKFKTLLVAEVTYYEIRNCEVYWDRGPSYSWRGPDNIPHGTSNDMKYLVLSWAQSVRGMRVNSYFASVTIAQTTIVGIVFYRCCNCNQKITNEISLLSWVNRGKMAERRGEDEESWEVMDNGLCRKL